MSRIIPTFSSTGPRTIPAYSEGQWQRVDLSTWTLTAGTVADLVTAVTPSSITIADKTANTAWTEWTMLSGPTPEAGYLYMVKIVRTNAGADDRCGVYIGLRDAPDSVPLAVGGPYEDGAGNQPHVTRIAGTTASNADGCVSSVTSVFVDASNNLVGCGIVGFADNGTFISAKAGALGVTTSPEICAFVEHGLTGVGAPSVFEYEVWIKKTKIAAP